MNIDFHYGVLYVLARLGGLEQKDAEIVAHASQYVDDSTKAGVLEFTNGASYDRFASAHAMEDHRNAQNLQNKIVWAPFHFLPGGEGESLEEKLVCKPDSKIAREMVKQAIANKGADNDLHRLGVSLHVYVDTWAHQKFTGTISHNNKVSSLEAEDLDHKSWFAMVKERFGIAIDRIESEFLDEISGLGHGAALHYPDWPWAKWKYTNGYGKEIERSNLPIFMEAADKACKAIQGFVNGNANYESELGLGKEAKAALEALLARNKDKNEHKRLDVIAAAVESGEIPGLNESIPKYIAKGEGSWKYQATGILDVGDGEVLPDWSEEFEKSDYRKFHDAVKEHRFLVTHEILPQYGIRLA